MNYDAYVCSLPINEFYFAIPTNAAVLFPPVPNGC